jgi:hypothetical protein
MNRRSLLLGVFPVADILQSVGTTYIFVLGGVGDEMIFGMKPDGSVDFGPAFTTKDEAATEFIKFLGLYVSKHLCKELP